MADVPEVLHTDRRRAESFGGVAEAYDAARPGYPDEVIAAVLGDHRPVRVLDVGCGTGIASRLMAAAGANVVGVEIDARMAGVARRRGTAVEAGPFEGWDPGGRRFDRVTSFQAWHWIDPVAGAARSADVLDGGGRLCLVWSGADLPDDVAGDMRELYQRWAPELARPQNPDPPEVEHEFAGVFAGICADGRFDDPQVHSVEWSSTTTAEGWAALLATQSNHIALPDDVRAGLLKGAVEVVDRHGGLMTVSTTTVIVSATRR
ncbi:MAG TPA: class I SAM-dependent methyltransferase [Acidimicrobiales bacterium]|nr:class I SAM-dependent methyltransferase [Acidimicrobiales bacterium]